MKRRRLLIGGIAGGWALVALFGLGPAQGETEQPAPPATLHRIADLNGDAAANAAAALRARSQASAEAADARIMRAAEAGAR